MKIVHICTGGLFYSGYGYQENLLTKYQRKLGHDITVIAPTYSKYLADGTMGEDPVGTTYLNDGIKVVRLKARIPLQAVNKHLHLVCGLKKAMLAENPDIIFVHNVASWNFRCLKSVKEILPKVKIAFDNHADESNSTRTPATKFLHGFIYRHFLMPTLNKVADKFYGVTPGRCEFLDRVYGADRSKTDLLLMGADDEKLRSFNIADSRKNIRTRFGFSDSDFLLVTGGKIEKNKRTDIIIEAVKACDDRVKLLIFGSISSDLEEYIRQSLSDKIKYAGWVNSDDVYEYFMAADAIIYAGRHSVLWEQSAACRIPCIFPKIKGWEHVDIGDGCIMVENPSAEKYKQIITELTTAPTKYKEMQSAAATGNADKFMYGTIAQKVINDLTNED